MKLLALSLLASFSFSEASPLAAAKAPEVAHFPAPAKVRRGPTTLQTAASLVTPTVSTIKSSKPTSKSPSTVASSKPTTSIKPTSAQYNITHPTEGCTPDKCARCKSKRDSLFDLDSASTISNDLYPRAPAPSSPKDKTEDGLNKWTSEVFGSSPKVLDLGSGKDFKPTSMFVPWSGTGSATFPVVKGLFGCATVVVVSDDGVYLSHHWQNTISDLSLKDIPEMWANAFTNALQDKGVQPFKPIPDQPWITKDDVESVYPPKGDSWEPLKSAVERSSKPFDSSKKPQSAIVVWKGEDGKEAFGRTFTKAAAEMQKVVKDTVPALSANPKLVQYENGKEPREDADATDNYHGKVIVSWDSDKKKYEVWMAAASVKEPALKSA